MMHGLLESDGLLNVDSIRLDFVQFRKHFPDCLPFPLAIQTRVLESLLFLCKTQLNLLL